MRGNGFLILVLGLIALAAILLVTSQGSPIAGLDEEQFGQAAYIGIWGLVLASGLVFMVRADPGGALRHAVMWVVAFVALVGAYAYRDDARSIKDRLMSALVPGRTVEVGGSDGRQFMVTRAGDDHFHVEAEINGRSLSFLVDTGATVVALDRAAAERLGIDTTRLSFSSRVMTANGLANAARTRLTYVKIGSIERSNVEAAILEDRGDDISLLGMSFLGQLSSFEFRGDRLILTD